MAISDFDDILPHVGSFGPYQIRILLLSLPVNYFLAVVYMGQIYQTLTPEHWCHVPELSHLSLEQRRSLSIPAEFNDGVLTYSKCRVYDVNYSQPELLTSANTSWPTRTCSNGWDYDFSGGMYPTIVTEENWVCDDDWRGNFAQAMFFLGAMLGSFLFGLLGDMIGRLPVLIYTNLLACVAGIATAYAYDFTSYVVCRFIVGLAYDVHWLMMYIILLEYVGPEKRTMVANVPLAVFLTLGAVTLPWIACTIGNWRTYSIVTSAPLALIVIAWWIVPESARWMVLRGKIEETIKTLKHCARVNHRTVNDAVYDEFKMATTKAYEKEKENPSNWLDLFRTPKMRSRMILMTVAWMLVTVVYDGHLRSLSILSYNVFVTNSIAGALELPADLMPILTMDSIGRRWTLSGGLILSGTAAIATGLVPIDWTLTMALLAMIGRFCVTVVINGAIQYTVELMPTQLRGQGVSAIHISGHGATFFAPLILYLSTYQRTLPYIVLGALSILGALVCLLLPETAMENLPETVADAESFGNDQKFWDMPHDIQRRRLGKTSDTSSETSRKEDPTQEDIQCDDTIEQKSNITAKMLAVMTTSQTKCNRDSCCRNIIDEPNYDSTMAHCYTNCEPIESLVTSF